jgi:hypothetical protein
MPRELRPFLLIVGVLVLAAMALEHANGRFWLSDLRVYWGAADALINGGRVYGVAFGEDTGFYKYAPAVAVAFVPAALLPFSWVAHAHFLLIGVALGIVFVRLERLMMRDMFYRYPPRILGRALLGLLCIAVLLSRELHLGNINLWLVVLLILGAEALIHGARARAGICFGLLWLIKPYLLLIAVPLVIRGEWRTVVAAFVTILVGLFIPFILLGPTTAWQLHREWIAAMAAHSGYLQSPDTFESLLSGSFGRAMPAHFGVFAITGVGILLAVWVLLRKQGHRRATRIDHPILFELFVAFALVPHLVITDQEHFLFSLPLVIYSLAMLFTSASFVFVLTFAAAMVLYATRSSDLWGATEDVLVAHGALGWGALLLLLTAILLERSRSSWLEKHRVA